MKNMKNMKKKTLIFIIIAALWVVTWVIMANRFEANVQQSYLPMLAERKEQGLVDVDMNNIRIHKYIFKVVIDDLTILPKSDNFRTHFEQISGLVNPFASSVTFCSAGKISINFGGNSAYVKDSKVSVRINKPLLEYGSDDIYITLHAKPFELLNSEDNKVLISLNEYTADISGEFDNATNLYSLSFEENAQKMLTGANYFKWSDKVINRSFTQDNKLLSDVADSFSAYLDSAAEIYGPSDYNTSYNIIVSKEFLTEVYSNILKGELNMAPKAIALALGSDKKPFDISLNNSYTNNANTSKLTVTLASDGKEFKSKIDMTMDNHYPKDKVAKLISIYADLFAKIANSIKAKATVTVGELRGEDFNKLAEYLIEVKKFDISANMIRSLESSNFNGGIKLGINDHHIELNAKELSKNSYTGSLKLSDPLKMINAKTKFAHNVVLPLAQKFDSANKNISGQVEKFVVNVEQNGFDALKVLNNSELKEEGSFEAAFTFDPEKFDFKINNKSFLSIITDDRMVKFLKGLEDITFFENPVSGDSPREPVGTAMPEEVKSIFFESDD